MLKKTRPYLYLFGMSNTDSDQGGYNNIDNGGVQAYELLIPTKPVKICEWPGYSVSDGIVRECGNKFIMFAISTFLNLIYILDVTNPRHITLIQKFSSSKPMPNNVDVDETCYNMYISHAAYESPIEYFQLNPLSFVELPTDKNFIQTNNISTFSTKPQQVYVDRGLLWGAYHNGIIFWNMFDCPTSPYAITYIATTVTTKSITFGGFGDLFIRELSDGEVGYFSDREKTVHVIRVKRIVPKFTPTTPGPTPVKSPFISTTVLFSILAAFVGLGLIVIVVVFCMRSQRGGYKVLEIDQTKLEPTSW